MFDLNFRVSEESGSDNLNMRFYCLNAKNNLLSV